MNKRIGGGIMTARHKTPLFLHPAILKPTLDEDVNYWFNLFGWVNYYGLEYRKTKDVPTSNRASNK